jgi:hypothetical protein
MKRALLATTALIAAAVVADRIQAAEPIRLTLGGCYETAAGAELGGPTDPASRAMIGRPRPHSIAKLEASQQERI